MENSKLGPQLSVNFIDFIINGGNYHYFSKFWALLLWKISDLW